MQIVHINLLTLPYSSISIIFTTMVSFMQYIPQYIPWEPINCVICDKRVPVHKDGPARWSEAVNRDVWRDSNIWQTVWEETLGKTSNPSLALSVKGVRMFFQNKLMMIQSSSSPSIGKSRVSSALNNYHKNMTRPNWGRSIQFESYCRCIHIASLLAEY